MFFRITLLCFGFIALAVVAKQKDSLRPAQSMNASTTLVSSRNVFIMGCFTSEDSDISDMGIWYTDRIAETTPRHPAWIVNRNTPISYSSGILSIDPRSGNLFIDHNNAVNPIISLYSGRSESSGSFNRTSTQLHTGNFILKEGSLSLWQSFDHPTDAVLPGMKLGINDKTNHTQSLISRLDVSDQSLRGCTLGWDPRERSLIVKFWGKIRWTSGASMDNNFEHVRLDEDYRYKNVLDKEEDYFIYTAVGVTDYDECETPHRQLFQNKNTIDKETFRTIVAVGHKTAGLDPSSNIAGCELWDQPKCRKIGQKLEFQTINSSSGLQYVRRLYSLNSCDHLKQKRKKVKIDQKLDFWTSYSSNAMQLVVTYSDSLNSSNRLKQKRKKGKPITIIIVLVIVVILFLSGLLRVLWEKIKQAKQKDMGELFTMNEYREAINDDGINEIKFFGFTSIAAATMNFSSDNKLGEGGFGPVYKGKFPEGKEIAVKRLSKKSKQGMMELKNELILTAQLQHTNLVRILGCCVHREEKMLIYDYMPNKSLDFFLFNESKREHLTWDRRFTIIEGIAQGLLYLHKYSRLRVIHRDLKASNILLDQNMNPKISDFGLARIFKQDAMEENTMRVVGTYGYMAPEYAMEGIFSIKSDVYSFGVLILEILSGRKNNSFYDAEIPFNLVSLAWECWNRDGALELMDPSLNSSCIQHQFLRCVHVGLLCVEDRPPDRPTMAHVISMLVNENADLALPKRPAFYTGSRAGEKESAHKISVNDITITEMEAR